MGLAGGWCNGCCWSHCSLLRVGGQVRWGCHQVWVLLEGAVLAAAGRRTSRVMARKRMQPPIASQALSGVTCSDVQPPPAVC